MRSWPPAAPLLGEGAQQMSLPSSQVRCRRQRQPHEQRPRQGAAGHFEGLHMFTMPSRPTGHAASHAAGDSQQAVVPPSRPTAHTMAQHTRLATTPPDSIQTHTG